MKTILGKLKKDSRIPSGASISSNDFLLLQQIPMEVAVLDTEGIYLFANKYYIPDRKIARKIIGKNDEYYFKLMGITASQANRRGEYFLRAIQEKKTVRFTENIFVPAKNRNLYYTRFYQPILSDGNSGEITHILFFGRDITAIIHAQKELRSLSYSDKLTGLKNRNAFYEQLEQLVLEADRNETTQLKALLFCDLDNFKLVNDTYGHDVGDFVLKEAAKRMYSCLRKSDHVFRLGSDEFTIIIRNLKNELDAGKVAEKIIQKISEPYVIGNQKITSISTSIGIVPFTNEKHHSDFLVKKGDTAMYLAKYRGKNNFQFISESMTQKALHRLQIEKTLRDLIDSNKFDEQFKLLYQPIVQRKSNGEYRIVGAEALIRWHNPELGLIMPNSFIPISEETDLIRELGNWVLNKSCSDFSSLISNSDFPLYISINVSARQLKYQNILEQLEETLKYINIKPENLQLEITETSFVEYEQNVIENIRKLHEMGIKLAVDDFGVGFASLSYLQRLPASTIKIDRSFISNIGQDNESNDFIKSIIALGRSIGKEIIAEGVESPEQVDFLFAQECNQYQGYLFSRPVDLDKFKSLLQKPQYDFVSAPDAQPALVAR